MFLVLLLYALFASVFTISKNALEYSPPFFLVGTRMLVGGLLMLTFLLIFRPNLLKIKKEDWGMILKLSIINIYLTNVFEFWGLKYLTSFKTCFIYSLSPFVAALFAYYFFKEKISSKKILGLVVGFLGFLPILLTQTNSEKAAGELLFFSWAELAVMLAAVCSVYGWIQLQQIVRKGYSPLVANGSSMTIGGILALAHSFGIENWNPIPVTDVLPFAECTLLLILISNLICYNLYGYLLKKYSATFMSFAGFSTAFFTAFFGWLFLGEIVTWPFYLSAVIVFSGLMLFYQEELRQPNVIRKPT